jgi:hypothetical protein
VIRVYSISEPADEISDGLLGSRIGVMLRKPGDTDFQFQYPWELKSPIELTSGAAVSETLQVLAPPGMMVAIRGLFIDNGNTRVAVDAINDPGKLVDRIENWVEENCSQIEIDLGVLGSFSIHVPQSAAKPVTEEPEKAVEFNITDEQVNRGLISFEGGLPRKARWKVVRTLLGLPPGTKHHLIESGTKKRIRIQLMGLKEMKDGNH